jgi:hypothetical protein
MGSIEIDLTKPAPPKVYQGGDYVLYRNPEKYLTGRSDHTTVARIVAGECGERSHFHFRNERVTVVDLATGERLTCVQAAYLRRIPAADVMRDIDEAPLNAEHPELVPAAVAWLQQHTRRGES